MTQNLVSAEHFELTAKALSLQVRKLQEMLTLLITVMRSHGVVSEPLCQEILQRAAATKTGEEMRKTLASLRDYEAIHSILKGFEGPVQ